MNVTIIRAGLLVCMLTAGTVSAEQRALDAEASVIKWTGKKIGGAHSGTLKLKSGTVTLADGVVTRGDFVIDMTSIKNTDLESEALKAKLEGHLKSDDFFSTAKYPEASFEIKKVELVKDAPQSEDFMVAGTLTIKGISHQIEFPARIVKAGEIYEASAKPVIDRSRWKIKYNSKSFFDAAALGDRLIYDDIEIELQLKTKK